MDVLFLFMDVEISGPFLARLRNWAGSENLVRKERFGSQHERSYYLGTSRTKKQRIKLKDFRKGRKKSEES